MTKSYPLIDNCIRNWAREIPTFNGQSVLVIWSIRNGGRKTKIKFPNINS